MNRVSLPKLDSVPDLPVLGNLMHKAQQAREDIIAQPFEGLGGGHFVLAISYSSSKRNVPRWYLFAGEEEGAPLVWVRETPNREEILLILSGRASRAGAPKEPEKPRVSADGLIRPADFDQASYYQFYQKLIDPDTSMFPPGAFYWFLSQELVRYQRTKTSFALVLLDPRLGSARPDGHTMAWVGQLLTSQMRKLDYVCGLKSQIAVLLAASELSEALNCAQRLSDMVAEKSAVRNPGAPLTVYAGVAAIPETCEHPGVLISAAEIALKKGMAGGVKISAFDPAMAK
ncbi:MAG: diguanylate cyclase [Cyanobacteria bacterium SZAS LIN-3]|nr:diguanylate cyclase [Cyanobacteria bacterium SZAS LIN-3]MBS2005562.1 diguanylate cyclase [Cyanobacteria bacterium SZAS TMP-1]